MMVWIKVAVHECRTCTGEVLGNNDQCAYCIRADAEDAEFAEDLKRIKMLSQAPIIQGIRSDVGRHPCAAIGCTNTVPFADEPRCYTHTRW